MSDYAKALARQLDERTARITVMGQGYVGLPLAVEFAKAGFLVTGFDTGLDRVASRTTGRSHVTDISDEELQALLRRERYRATSDASVLAESHGSGLCSYAPCGNPRTRTSRTWSLPRRKRPRGSVQDSWSFSRV